MSKMKTPDQITTKENFFRILNNIDQASSMVKVLLEVANEAVEFIDKHEKEIDEQYKPHGAGPIKQNCGYIGMTAIKQQLRMFDQEKCPFCKEDSEVN